MAKLRGRPFIYWLLVPLIVLFFIVWLVRHPWGLPVYHGQAGTIAGEECINPTDRAEMVWIPAGEFVMGSSDQQITKLLNLHRDTKRESVIDEEPQHRVYVDGFWMYKNLVTIPQYRKYCKANDMPMPVQIPVEEGENCSVKAINWDDAMAYAKWAGASLPTEAQWEKAARGTDNRLYPWGKNWDIRKCSGSDLKIIKPEPVGSYPSGASPYGCLDMVGNVAQWCRDWYEMTYYQHSPARNPHGPDKGEWRVLRGGDIYEFNDSIAFRCANRMGYHPSGKYIHIGFRCVVHPDS